MNLKAATNIIENIIINAFRNKSIIVLRHNNDTICLYDHSGTAIPISVIKITEENKKYLFKKVYTARLYYGPEVKYEIDALITFTINIRHKVNIIYKSNFRETRRKHINFLF